MDAFLLNRGPRGATIVPDGDRRGRVIDMGRAQPAGGKGGYWNLVLGDASTTGSSSSWPEGRAMPAFSAGRRTSTAETSRWQAPTTSSSATVELEWPSIRQGLAYLAFLDAVTPDLIETGETWKLVESLAGELLERKTLSARGTRDLGRGAKQEPRRGPKLPYAAP